MEEFMLTFIAQQEIFLIYYVLHSGKHFPCSSIASSSSHFSETCMVEALPLIPISCNQEMSHLRNHHVGNFCPH